MLTIDMHRLRPIVGRGTELVTAAVTSIILTVLTMISTVLRVHADQVGWAEVTAAPATAPVDHGDAENGGGSAWV